MKFQICTGKYETFGVTKEKDILSFSLQAGEKATCNLLLYPKEKKKRIEFLCRETRHITRFILWESMDLIGRNMIITLK